MAETVSFMAACRKFFGLKDGQTALDFGKEVRALSAQDRLDMIPGLERELGVVIS